MLSENVVRVLSFLPKQHDFIIRTLSGMQNESLPLQDTTPPFPNIQLAPINFIIRGIHLPRPPIAAETSDSFQDMPRSICSWISTPLTNSEFAPNWRLLKSSCAILKEDFRLPLRAPVLGDDYY